MEPEGSLPPGNKHLTFHPTLSKRFPIIFIIYLLQIPNNVILPPDFRPTTWALPLIFLEEDSVPFFHIHSCNMPRPPQYT